DGSARSHTATGIENVDTNMPIDLQRPSCRQHEQTGVRIEDRFLQPDRAEAERVAKDDHRKLSDNDIKRAPRRNAAHRRRDAINFVGDAHGRVSHGWRSYYNPP